MVYSYEKLENVKSSNKRENIYIPPHKKWITLLNLISEEDGVYEYETVKLGWRNEFEDKQYIEDNFEELFVKPAFIEYPEPEVNEDEMMEFK